MTPAGPHDVEEAFKDILDDTAVPDVVWYPYEYRGKCYDGSDTEGKD